MARALLEQYIGRLPSLTLAGSLGSPVKALQRLQTDPPDVVFLDVQMPELTGISLLRVLKTKPAVVLTTAYADYAIEGYELDVTDYLLKPITFERFLMCVDKLLPTTTTAPPVPEDTRNYLFVKDGTKSVRVRLADIQYIEGLKDYVRIHTPQRNITTLQSLRGLVEALPADRFLRTHHSYIVGLDWVEEVSRDSLKIGETQVPISDSYRKEVRQFVEERYLK
ncbi:Transcriptional regulatory protein YpdB [Neolewinella maritima]|uniref:Transcriptional regulatory protein YpdB n=2 Tax=Neolewinella maritima TaxID=1383882 RepID=A0ABM9AZ02_9BACT|nr:Transcriptional regulatory protein YpdB [Neolewinella maritima]